MIFLPIVADDKSEEQIQRTPVFEESKQYVEVRSDMVYHDDETVVHVKHSSPESSAAASERSSIDGD